LTIKEEELNNNYCPECYESSGKKHAEFEVIETKENIRYRCEDCHTIIEYSDQNSLDQD
jgi:ribosomal protein L44E